MTSHSEQNSICCPKFDPIQWDDKIFEWDNKKFIKDSVFTLFYMPVNFGKVMKRLNEIWLTVVENLSSLEYHKGEWWIYHC